MLFQQKKLGFDESSPHLLKLALQGFPCNDFTLFLKKEEKGTSMCSSQLKVPCFSSNVSESSEEESRMEFMVSIGANSPFTGVAKAK